MGGTSSSRFQRSSLPFNSSLLSTFSFLLYSLLPSLDSLLSSLLSLHNNHPYARWCIFDDTAALHHPGALFKQRDEDAEHLIEKEYRYLPDTASLVRQMYLHLDLSLFLIFSSFSLRLLPQTIFALLLPLPLPILLLSFSLSILICRVEGNRQVERLDDQPYTSPTNARESDDLNFEIVDLFVARVTWIRGRERDEEGSIFRWIRVPGDCHVSEFAD